MAEPTPLERIIDALAGPDARIKLSMRMAAMLEGGGLVGPWGVGDSGQSFGPYQIHLPAHPTVTADKAQDPDFATRYMFGSFRDAVKRVADDLWQSDPALAAATAAYYAERPAYMYPETRVRNAYASLVKNGRLPYDGGGAGGSGGFLRSLTDVPGTLRAADRLSGGVTGGVLDAINPLDDLADVYRAISNPNAWWRVLFLTAGGLLVLAGLGMIGRGQIARLAPTPASLLADS